MTNICASCESVNIEKIIRSNREKIPEWLKSVDYVKDFICGRELLEYRQKITDTKLELNVGKHRVGKYCLYWAADPQKGLLVRDAKRAYNKFKNYGIAKVNSKGFVTLCINCPQCYSTIEKGEKKKETFYRHVHFCFSNKDNSKWLSSIFTKVVICNYNLYKTLSLHKRGNVVLINTLPCEYYAKSHIHNSYNLYHKDINKMTQKQLFEWFKYVIDINYGKLKKRIKTKKINYYEIPIVVYCAHDKCNASNLAALALLKKGFVNVSEFKGGMKKYLNN